MRVKDISDQLVTVGGKQYMKLLVSDGETEMSLLMRDTRVEEAKKRFLGKEVSIVLSEDKTRIKKIETIPAPEPQATAPAPQPPVKQPKARKKLSDTDMCPGAVLTLPVYVTAVEERTAGTGTPYARISVTDGERSAVYNCWIYSTAEITAKFRSHVCLMTVQMERFPKIVDLKLTDQYPVTDFIRQAPVPPQQMYNEIVQMLKENPSDMAPVALKIYQDKKEQLLRWTGAVKNHHVVYGGLLYHMYRMMKAAEIVAPLYECDKGLLLVGVVLHDIGKLLEFDTDEAGNPTWMPDGTLSGHLLLGVEMVTEAARTVSPQPSAENLRLVKHMVASHHGKQQYGAIVAPATKEAWVLHALDMLDARLYAYADIEQTLAPGTLSDPVWTLGTSVYAPIREGGDA